MEISIMLLDIDLDETVIFPPLEVNFNALERRLRMMV
jgi:hypothetical protein